MKPNLFITGTDTGCGKTYVSCGLLRSLGKQGVAAAGMKPIASGTTNINGARSNEDVDDILAAMSASADLSDVNPYLFDPPCSPDIAAAKAAQTVDLDRIEAAYARLSTAAETVVVEGVGGWCVPLAPGVLVSDLARALKLPVVLIVGIKLGCINHALLSARAVVADGMELVGWVANEIDREVLFPDEIIATISRELRIPPLSRLPFAQSSNPSQGTDNERGFAEIWTRIVAELSNA